jgi:hypothetical protein
MSKGSLRPVTAERFGEPPALYLIKLRDAGRQIIAVELGDRCLVELLVLGCSDLRIPVCTSGPVGSSKQTLEEVPGRGIDHDLREVLAADEVDVIDSQVYGSDLVTRCSM